MKRARVSSVYEGKERKRSRKGDEIRRDHSKHARITAKARMNIHKDSTKSLTKHKKSMVIKSMRNKASMQDNQSSVIVRVVEKEKEKTDDGAMETMEGKMKMPSSECLEEWPHTSTYEEEWIWFAFAFGWGWWWRYDAVMSGKNWFS
ncbi:hypothetical protein Bca4012_039771 [Brassica carinata]|uniref:Uncharacterized protein n=1 Tax=Brassica carinata TaxID=52824 RepID=A0A8X8B8E0_BRACI|nr:hypothetical protein Bca52824_008010 [Brassica carinata]